LFAQSFYLSIGIYFLVFGADDALLFLVQRGVVALFSIAAIDQYVPPQQSVDLFLEQLQSFPVDVIGGLGASEFLQGFRELSEQLLIGEGS
jgi:hypothetical protein